MLVIDKYASKPIYEQLTDGIERNILLGIMKEGEAIPSVRELSVALGINPNTIQKAYLELDRRGIVISSPGRGSFVREGAVITIKVRERKKLDSIRETARELRVAGVSREELIGIIDDIYKEEDK